MTKPWPTQLLLQRLTRPLKQWLSLGGDTRFQKYQVAPRPGAEKLRRRLLLRSSAGNPHESDSVRSFSGELRQPRTFG